MIKLTKNEFKLLTKKIKINGESKIKDVKLPRFDKKKCIENSTLEFSVSENHIALLFKGAKLYSVNQIFALLQSNKYELFKYKKIWHNKIRESLFYISKNHKINTFEKNVVVTVLRSDKRLVDEDALVTMFKFIIDGLRNNESDLRVISDDNKNVIKEIKCINLKGEPYVGIKLQLCNQIADEPNIRCFLNNESIL